MPVNRWQRRRITGTEDVDFITCRICGDRRRVISARHLSKHNTDRLAYMEEYDLSPDQLIAKAFRIIQSRDPGFKANSKAEWVAEIKKIYKRKGLTGLRCLQKNHFHLYLQAKWLFGGMDEGFRFIGLDPEEIRLRSFYEDERFHKEIWSLRRQKLPLYPYSVNKHHPSAIKHAIARHGSWNKALIAHGITPPPKRFRLHLLTQLQDALESGAKITRQFRWELEYYFGSVMNAKLELKTDIRILNAWGPKRVILEIQRRHRLKLRLIYTVVRVECLALLNAAQRFFGSWGNALYSAGIDPNLYFVTRTWRKKPRKLLPLAVRRNPQLLASKILRRAIGG